MFSKKVAWALGLVVFGCGGEKPAAEPPTNDLSQTEVTAPPAASQVDSAAAAASAAAPAPAPVAIGDAVKKYVAESTAAWAAKDVKKAAALYTDDAIIAIAGAGGIEESKVADLEKQRAMYFTSFPDLEMTYTRVVAKAPYAVAEWVFTGTNKGDMMGQKATNKKAGFRGATVITFTPDGKVKRETNYFDMGTMVGQLGLGPKGQPVRAAEAKPTAPTQFFVATDADSDAVGRSWLGLAERGDAKAISAMATDDIVVSNQYMPTDTKGRKAIEKELAEGGKAFSDQKNNIVLCVPAGGLVACEYQWTATWKGAFMGMKATGKTGTVHSLDVMSVKDGKINGTVAYGNAMEFAKTFGLMDEKPKDAGKEPAKKDAGKEPAKKDPGKK